MKRTLFRTSGLALTCTIGCLQAAAQNLLLNPGFEEGAAQPTGWRLADGAGQWVESAHSGKRAVMVEGKGDTASCWRAENLPLKPGGVYRLRFFARREPGASGGCAIAGLSRVNRDFQLTEDWQPHSFVFSVPDDGTNDFLRLGQWQVKGEVFFDDVELLPVLTSHSQRSSGGRTASPSLDLGEAENLEAGVYRFRPQFDGPTANYHRPLWRNRASFNSTRWIFSPGAEVVYRFALPGLTQTNGRVRVAINYYESGTLRVEASRDAQTWVPFAAYDGRNRGGTNELPVEVFPASEVFLRLSLAGAEGNLQVDACDYEAGMAGRALRAEGATQFFEVSASRPELQVSFAPVTTQTGPGELLLCGRLTNQSQRALSLRFTVEADGAVGTASSKVKPGGQTTFCPSTRVSKSGTHPLTLKIEDAAGQTLFFARTDARVGMLFDPRPGYWLGGDDGVQVWWCESAWKLGSYMLGRESPARNNPGRVHVAAARGEFEAAQIVIGGLSVRSLDSATASPFRNGRGETAPITLRLHEVALVHVTHPTDASGERGFYPDPLPPLQTPLKLNPGGSRALWLTFYVPREAKPGDYTGQLKLVVDGKTRLVPLAVHVYDFSLPEETHLRSALGLGTHSINQYHRLTRPEDKQAVYEKYLRNFAEHRISPYSFFDYAPMDVRFVGEGTNKHAQVDFTRFDQAAAKWLDQYHFNSFLLPLRGMGGGTFHSRYLGELESFKEGTPEHARLFRDYLSQIEDHLHGRGWLRKAYTYWFDEPDRKDYEFVVAGMDRIKAAAPGIRRMLTEQPEPELQSHVEIWCGLTPEWTQEKVAARRAAGEEVWWYICCAPKAPYVTEFIDHPGTELRLWPWQSWQYSLQGILIWETLYWTSTSAFPPPKLQDPWQDPMSYVSGYDFGPGHIGYWGNGDGRFLYPPRRDPNTATEPCLDAPINSIRWENLRDGMEDYEYFWLLEQAVKRVEALNRESLKRETAEARRLLVVPEDISKDLTHFTTDPRLMLAHRDRVARMIEELQKVR
jgi:hypothetical protein